MDTTTGQFSLHCATSKKLFYLRLILIAVGIATASTAGMIAGAAEAARSQWVYTGPDGKLAYKITLAGDRIMDFSSAGYMGGGVALPDVPVKVTVKPSG